VQVGHGREETHHGLDLGHGLVPALLGPVDVRALAVRLDGVARAEGERRAEVAERLARLALLGRDDAESERRVARAARSHAARDSARSAAPGISASGSASPKNADGMRRVRTAWKRLPACAAASAGFPRSAYARRERSARAHVPRRLRHAVEERVLLLGGSAAGMNARPA